VCCPSCISGFSASGALVGHSCSTGPDILPYNATPQPCRSPPQLSAVFADGVSGETPLCGVIMCHCASGRSPGVSHGEHVICNKQWGQGYGEHRRTDGTRRDKNLSGQGAAQGGLFLSRRGGFETRQTRKPGGFIPRYSAIMSASGPTGYAPNSLSRALASCRSAVSKPSVNQPYTGARRS
jgi:hypothetical protein